MSKEKEHKFWCIYCKNEIYEGDAFTTGSNGKIYHPFCYNQENNCTDDFEGTFEERDYE